LFRLPVLGGRCLGGRSSTPDLICWKGFFPLFSKIFFPPPWLTLQSTPPLADAVLASCRRPCFPALQRFLRVLSQIIFPSIISVADSGYDGFIFCPDDPFLKPAKKKHFPGIFAGFFLRPSLCRFWRRSMTYDLTPPYFASRRPPCPVRSSC